MKEPAPRMEDAHEREATVLESYLRALDAGEEPDREELLARHPDLASELRKALDGLDLVHRASKRASAEEFPAAKDGSGVGPVLGDYRLLREVGRGGMAVVYEAEQISLKRRVALKVLPFAAVLDPRRLQRFENEALAAAHLQHPNIVSVYGVGSERGVHYYAMQYVEGQSLDRAIRELKAGTRGEGPATPISSHASNREPAYLRMAATLGKQAAEALHHAHHLGIVHRDVKPANCLVDQTGTLRVTDFGLARCSKDTGLTLTGELLGTVRYMSPEQAHVKPLPIDHRTDVYSLGATLYELFTLEPAFPGDDHHEVIEDIACREPVPPRRLNPALSHDLETVVLKALAKDPAGRYATAQELADDLGRYLADEPVLARRPSFAARAARWGGRHRGLVAASFALLLLGLMGLAAYGVRIADEQRKTHAALAQARDAVDRYLVETGIADFECSSWITPAVKPEFLEAALAFYGPDQEDPHSLVQRTTILHALSRYGEALATLDRALAAGPPDVRTLRRHAEMLQHLGRLPEAQASWDRALAMDPHDADAHFQRGRAAAQAGRAEVAIEAYRRAIDLGLDDRRAHFAHYDVGRELHSAGDFRAAIREYREALRLEPRSASAHQALGAAFLEDGDADGAIDALREAVRLQPGFGVAHAQLAIALSRSGEPKAALREYREAVRAFRQVVGGAPSDAESLKYMGISLHETGDFTGAVAAFREAIAKGRADALHYLGVTLSVLGDREGAIAAYREGSADPRVKDPRHRALTLCFLANELRVKGESKEAVAGLREAIRLWPDFAPAYADLGVALEESGESGNRGLRAFRKAISLDGDNWLAHRNLAATLTTRGDYAGALGEWRETFRLRPDDAEGRYMAARSLVRAAARGEPDATMWRVRALEWLHAALRTYQTTPGDLGAVLGYWKSDPRLTSVRDRIDEIPAPEREDWRRLWSDVDEALARAQETR